MVLKNKENLFKKSSYSKKNEINLELKLKLDEKDLINALNKYLQLNYKELYSQNNLDIVFKKVIEDKELKIKMFDVISVFLLN